MLNKYQMSALQVGAKFKIICASINGKPVLNPIARRCEVLGRNVNANGHVVLSLKYKVGPNYGVQTLTINKTFNRTGQQRRYESQATLVYEFHVDN